MVKFKVISDFSPTIPQKKVIGKIIKSIENGNKFQTLVGITGSGKTFVMAKVIEKLNRPTLVLSHNKTLTAQLYQEFKNFFPENRVEYFVSYYDYYQPEAYLPAEDIYIDKDAKINEEIDKLRHSATMALLERRDVIIVSSVSCIYGLGSPEIYYKLTLQLKVGMNFERIKLLKKLTELQYERNDYELLPGRYRIRGDSIDIYPPSGGNPIKLDFFGNELESISIFDKTTGKIISKEKEIIIFPATHFVIPKKRWDEITKNIEEELNWYHKKLLDKNKLIEAQRILERTKYDIEMLREMGYCHGIENYSRHITGRKPGEPPPTLLDYFPDDYLIFIDESHVTVPQIRGMYEGDRSRKKTLVDFGFRLPSALDNRPLNFSEFMKKAKQILFVSATPGKFEMENSSENMYELIIRPTGLLDPEIEVKPTKNQIEIAISEIKKVVKRKERVLITTLTKKLSEDLTKFLKEVGINAKYLHSEIKTIERIKILKGLREGEIDVIVGVNLLREGLDLPEVSLILIFDADREGFLRSYTSLIQTIGRAARNLNGKVIMFGDKITYGMKRAMDETNRRRKIQMEYNEKHNLKPKSIKKSIKFTLIGQKEDEILKVSERVEDLISKISDKRDIKETIKELENEMMDLAHQFKFEEAIVIREKIKELKELFKNLK